MVLIKTVTQYDLELKPVLEEALQDIERKCENYRLPLTAKLLHSFVTKCAAIRSSIYHSLEHEDIYSANILYRSLIEHTLRTLMIVLRAVKEDSDAVSTEYFLFCDIMEEMELAKAAQATTDLLKGTRHEKGYRDILMKSQSRYAMYTEKEIADKARSFTYKHIVRKAFRDIELMGGGKSMLPFIITEYSRVCSYAHGGPKADKYWAQYRGLEDKSIEIGKLVLSTFKMSHIQHELAFIFFALLDEKYLSITTLLEKIRTGIK
jgi:hypothetical protein